MLRDIVVLAADAVAYNTALQNFQAATSLAGAGVLIGGIAMLFSKYWPLGLIVCIAALALIAYPWLAFEPMPVR